MPLNIQLRKIPYIIAWGTSKGIKLPYLKFSLSHFSHIRSHSKRTATEFTNSQTLCLQNRASNKKKDKWKNHRYNNFLIEVFELLLEIKENVSSTKRTLHYTKFVCRLAS